jgi:hypothetical protein
MEASGGGLLLWILAIGLVLIGITGTVVPGLPGAIGSLPGSCSRPGSRGSRGWAS